MLELEGFPTSWTEQTIVSILKMIPRNYRATMIEHYLAKLYGSILKSELHVSAEWNGCHSAGQVGFQKVFTTLDHIGCCLDVLFHTLGIGV